MKISVMDHLVAGPNRRVEGRNGMVYVEGDWVDEEAVGHKEMDE